MFDRRYLQRLHIDLHDRECEQFIDLYHPMTHRICKRELASQEGYLTAEYLMY